ncbi:hypothetical protein [Phytoactinopolyspora endophytica]|uniref:hypothetical protein n=1 Tax=Phytoactinopolyspora endophytica TaxID=1642495 RepID=UPI003B8338BE
MENGAKERELEQAILDDIQRFLLELGHGFALYGRQTAPARQKSDVHQSGPPRTTRRTSASLRSWTTFERSSPTASLAKRRRRTEPLTDDASAQFTAIP